MDIKRSLLINICLFSISGILAILAGDVFSVCTQSTYFGFSFSEIPEIIRDIIFSLLILAFFIGYNYEYSNLQLKETNAKLPDITSNSVECFIKMLPVMVIWSTYVGMLIFAGLAFFELLTPLSYTYYGLVLSIIPFVNLLFILYSKDFGYNYSIYNPAKLVSVIIKTSKSVVLQVLKTAIAAIITVFVLYKCFRCSANLANYPTLQLGVRIFLLTLSIYASFMLSLFYTKISVEIVKNKCLE